MWRQIARMKTYPKIQSVQMKKTDYKKMNNTTHKNVVAESKTGIYRNTQDAKDVYTDIDGYRITTLKKRKR
jgi:carbohydrate-selective porin OprB